MIQRRLIATNLFCLAAGQTTVVDVVFSMDCENRASTESCLKDLLSIWIGE